MRTKDYLQEFVTLRETLQSEKIEIENRLKEITAALDGETTSSVAGPDRTSVPISARRRRRIKNPMPLTKAVIRVTANKPLTKKEILAEISKLGYEFATKDPMNSLNAVLYGRKPKFKNENRRFSLRGKGKAG